MRSSLRINYADPGGVGNVVTGTEAKTGRTDFDLKRAVLFVDAMALSTPATTDDHLFSIRRLNGQVTDLFTWTQILPANANTVKPAVQGKGIGVGTVQFIAEEIAAAAAGVNVLYTFDKPLIG
jgi:hypothetical protein